MSRRTRSSGASFEIVPKVAVPLRAMNKAVLRTRLVEQQSQGEEERMQEDQPEGGFAEPLCTW